jgi:hypothetical protein
MAVVIYKNPNIVSKKNKAFVPDYSGLTINISKINYINDICDKLLQEYEKYKDQFIYLPIFIEFDSVLPKTSRIKNIFKCDKRFPKEI